MAKEEMPLVAPTASEDLGAAFAALRTGLRNYLRRRVSDSNLVEDMIQDVFVKASAAISANRAPNSLTGWLYAAARTTVVDYYRSVRPDALELDENFPDAQLASDELLHQELVTCLRPLARQLPAIYRDTLLAHPVCRARVVVSDHSLQRTDFGSRLTQALGVRARLQWIPRMSNISRSLSACALVLLTAGAVAAQEAVSLSRQDQKVVPVTTYLPKGAACRGVALISPGAGGSEKGYQYLGEAMSSLGYLAVVVGHQESGRRALREHVRGNDLREGLSELITDPSAYRGRFMDIATAKQWAATKCHATESVLIGHSMGAATTMMEAGARNALGMNGADSFDVYIVLSPQGTGAVFPQNAWADIKRPVLSLTGTRDEELGGASWEVRTEPYLNMPAGCKWLGVIDGATHMNFAGNGMSGRTEALTTQIIGSFLDGVHRGDCRAPRQRDGIDVQSK